MIERSPKPPHQSAPNQFSYLDFLPSVTFASSSGIINTTVHSNAAIVDSKAIESSLFCTPASIPSNSAEPTQSTVHHHQQKQQTKSLNHSERCTCHLSQQKDLDCGSMIRSSSSDSIDSGIHDDSIVSLDSNGYPIPQSLGQLIRLIRKELGSNGLMDKDKVNVPRLEAIMANYKSNREEWDRFAFFDPYRYTRNLIDDGNGKYNLLLLCWGQNQCSPIHDHADAHCVLKVMAGRLVETRYAWPKSEGEQQPMQVTSKSILNMDEAGYMHDEIGLHRVSNPSATETAVSLHLYSPPIRMCQTFCEDSGVARKSGNCVFFSVKGEKTIISNAGLTNRDC